MSNSQRSCVGCQKTIPSGAKFCPECGRPQSPELDDSWFGERRVVTILFADLASFTAVSEDADPEDVIDMLNQVFARLMIECDREGGYLDKTVGDQMMVLFGAPKAHEDDPVRAVRAALAMQEAMNELYPLMKEKVGETCTLHIGIHSGHVVWGQVGPPGRTTPTVIGDAVNLAARLEASSKGGQTLVSEPVYLRTSRFFEFEVLQPITVKGKSGAIPVYSPVRPRTDAHSAQWLIDRSIPFMERSEEMDQLGKKWASVLDGTPRLMAFMGDPGTGKTRLMIEFLSSLADYPSKRQPLVFHTRFESGSGQQQFSPLLGFLKQVFGLSPDDTDLARRRKVEDRAQVLGISDQTFLPLMGYLLGWYRDDSRLIKSQQDLKRVQESAINSAVNLFVRQSARRPLLLLVDDFQWVDSLSLDWIRRLKTAARHLMQREYVRLMLIVASRPQTDFSIESLQLDEILHVPPLSDLARRDLVEHLLPGKGLPLALIDRISQESAGNIDYILQVTKGLVQSGQLVKKDGLWHLTRPLDEIDFPHSFAELVMANLDTLNPSTRSILQHAAVIGMRFSFTALAALCPGDDLEPTLSELEQRGLISLHSGTEQDRVYVFSQVMVREVAYGSILRKTRRDLHDRIAHLAEAHPAESVDDIEALAYHYQASGGDPEKVLTYSWLTGQRALAGHDFEQAYQHLKTAWDVADGVQGSEFGFRLDLAQALGDAATFTGHFEQAGLCYDAAMTLMQSREDRNGYAALLHRMGRLNYYKADMLSASEQYEQALEMAKSDPVLAAQINAEIRLLWDKS